MKIWVLSRTLMQEQIRLRVSNIQQYYKTPKVTEIMGNSAIDRMLKIRDLAAENRLMRQGGKFYEMEYRTIVTKNKKLTRKADGTVAVDDKRGDNFFMVTPDLLPNVPAAQVFNFELSVEPTFPLSKPLMQQKLNEWSANPIVAMSIQSGYYDFRKVADKITELNDFDPDEFLAKEGQPSKQDMLVNPQQMADMAHKENELMMNGQALVGTPYSTREHSEIHLGFMRSEKFQLMATDEIKKIFAKHLLDEEMAQNMRLKNMGAQARAGQSGNETPGLPGSMPPEMMAQAPGGQDGMRTREIAGIEGSDAKAAMPGRIAGSEMLPDFTAR